MNQSRPAEQGTNSAALQISDTIGSSLAVGIAGALVTGSAHRSGGLAGGIRTAGILTALIAVAGVIAAFRVEASHD
jgi:hypothetical protein